MAETFKERIIRHIRMTGPMPLAEYMQWCLSDSKKGYYPTQAAIGREGDFITAPEVSQMFGELLGVWAINAWQKLGAPQKFNLVELGPGRGTLMKDLLRAAKIFPAFLDAAQLQMVETSKALRQQQARLLENIEPKISWLETIEQITNFPTIIIANEFLDALPFRQYIKHKERWYENCIGLDDNEHLAWVLGTGVLDSESLPVGHENEPDGSVFEISTMRESLIGQAASHINEQTGVALFIDYGHITSDFGDTFQAMKNHRYINPLAEPGLCDLTSHVDFAPLMKPVEMLGLHAHPIMKQGEFLLQLGLLERAGSLGHGKERAIQNRLQSEAERLALPDQMGDLFKVFAFSSFENLWPFEYAADTTKLHTTTNEEPLQP